MQGQNDAILVLRNFGADVNAVTSTKTAAHLRELTPALLAAKQGHDGAVIRLLARRQEYYNDPFQGSGFHDNSLSDQTIAKYQDVTPLHMAVREHDVRLVREL